MSAPVALVQAPVWGRMAPPAALAQLAGALRERGHECVLFDLNNDFFHALPDADRALWRDGAPTLGARGRAGRNTAAFVSGHRKLLDAAVGRILATGARLVGFSVFESSVGLSLALAGRLKKREPGTRIVFGGPETAPGWQGGALRARPEVDAILPGEGEAAFTRLVETFGRTGKLAPEPEPEAPLDALAFADYSGFSLSRYDEPGKLFTFLSRGCVNRCSFCNEHLYLPRFRTRTGRRARDELAFQKQRHPGVTLFEFSDLLLNGRLTELLALADALIADGPRVSWAGQAIVRPFMTRAVLGRLAQAGLKALVLGVETGAPKVAARMGKGFALSEADRMVRETAGAGIAVIANFMLGFPGESESEFAQTLAFVERNRGAIAYANPGPAGTTIGPGTRLYERAAEYGLVLKKDEPHAWKSRDGANTPDVRRERYAVFAARCAELGVPLLPRDRANLRLGA